MLGLAAVALVITFILAGSNTINANTDLKSASETASTEFVQGKDYDLGKVYVYDGWETVQSSKYSSKETTTAYDVFVLFEARDNYCIGMLSVSSSDADAFTAIQDYANDDSQGLLELKLNAVGTAQNLESDRKHDLDERIDDIEDALGHTCTPVYYSFEYVSSSAANYKAGKSNQTGRHNSSLFYGGGVLTMLLVIAGIRRLLAASKAQKQLNQAYSNINNQQNMPDLGPNANGYAAPTSVPPQVPTQQKNATPPQENTTFRQ